MVDLLDRPNTPATVTLTDNIHKKVYSFPFNLNSLNWNYEIVQQSFDTIGGRVTQLLSARMTTMDLQGEAGSRRNLLDLYTNFKSLQDVQNEYKSSMTLHVPSQNLQFNVFLEQMQMGWDSTTVTYPYAMTFEVDQDISATNTLTNAAANRAIGLLGAGVGFSPSWNGLSASQISIQYSDLNQYSFN